MSDLPACPQCASNLTYQDGDLFVCPECAHEWSSPADAPATEEKAVVRDAVGNELHDGDAVTVIKDLKVKGSSLVVKMGTKVKEHPPRRRRSRYRLQDRRNRRNAVEIAVREKSVIALP